MGYIDKINDNNIVSGIGYGNTSTTASTEIKELVVGKTSTTTAPAVGTTFATRFQDGNEIPNPKLKINGTTYATNHVATSYGEGFNSKGIPKNAYLPTVIVDSTHAKFLGAHRSGTIATGYTNRKDTDFIVTSDVLVNQKSATDTIGVSIPAKEYVAYVISPGTTSYNSSSKTSQTIELNNQNLTMYGYVPIGIAGVDPNSRLTKISRCYISEIDIIGQYGMGTLHIMFHNVHASTAQTVVATVYILWARIWS